MRQSHQTSFKRSWRVIIFTHKIGPVHRWKCTLSLLHSINFYDPFGAECQCGCFEWHTESDFSLFNTSFYGLCCASPIVVEFNSCAIMIIYIFRLISIHLINPKYFQNILTTPDVFMWNILIRFHLLVNKFFPPKSKPKEISDRHKL